MPDIRAINEFLQRRPGLPLRNLLREGKIAGAEQRPPARHGRWFITRSR